MFEAENGVTRLGENCIREDYQCVLGCNGREKEGEEAKV